MPLDRRTDAAGLFWEDEHSADQQLEAVAAIANHMKFRPRSVVSLPVEKKSKTLAEPVHGGPIGSILSNELDQLGLVLDEVVSARTYYVAAGLVRAGVGMAIVDNFTAQASLTPGLAWRPLQPAITFDINAVYLRDRPLSRTASEFLDLLTTVIDEV